MPDWFRDKLLLPLIVGVVGFGLGIFGDEIRARLFPPEEKAAITGVDYQRGVRFSDYLKVTGKGIGGRSPAQLQQRGIVVFAEVDTTGYKGDNLHVTGTIIDAATNSAAQLPEPSVFGRFFKPEANKNHRSPDIWVPEPCTAGTYYVVVRVQRPIERGMRTLTHLNGPRFTSTATGCDQPA